MWVSEQGVLITLFCNHDLCPWRRNTDCDVIILVFLFPKKFDVTFTNRWCNNARFYSVDHVCVVLFLPPLGTVVTLNSLIHFKLLCQTFVCLYNNTLLMCYLNFFFFPQVNITWSFVFVNKRNYIMVSHLKDVRYMYIGRDSYFIWLVLPWVISLGLVFWVASGHL